MKQHTHCSRTFMVVILLSVFLASCNLIKTDEPGPPPGSPLPLTHILLRLEEKGGGFSLAEKNKRLTAEILKRGVRFKLTPETEALLERAGADERLIEAIRKKVITDN